MLTMYETRYEKGQTQKKGLGLTAVLKNVFRND
jgi:hypothetical protein